MSENLEYAPAAVPAGVPAGRDPDRRLSRALAWVGITAGVVFIVAVVFFSGFALGRGSGGWHRGHTSQAGPGPGCPMMRDGGGMAGPGMMRPGMAGPGMTGPGMTGPGPMDPDDMGPMQPGQTPASPAPSQR